MNFFLQLIGQKNIKLNLMLSGAFLFLLWLAIWQMQRGFHKAQIQAQFTAHHPSSISRFDSFKVVTKNQNYTHVYLEGYFDNLHSFLLENKVYEGRIGYEVLTPFQINKTFWSILVNRGWIPQHLSRKNTPFIPSVLSKVRIEGTLFWPEKSFSFKTTKVEKKWPHRIQVITPEFLEQNHLAPFILIMDKPLGTLFKSTWRPLYFSAARHYAYALQWLICSFIVFIVFIRINLKK